MAYNTYSQKQLDDELVDVTAKNAVLKRGIVFFLHAINSLKWVRLNRANRCGLSITIITILCCRSTVEETTRHSLIILYYTGTVEKINGLLYNTHIIYIIYERARTAKKNSQEGELFSKGFSLHDYLYQHHNLSYSINAHRNIPRIIFSNLVLGEENNIPIILLKL